MFPCILLVYVFATQWKVEKNDQNSPWPDLIDPRLSNRRNANECDI